MYRSIKAHITDIVIARLDHNCDLYEAILQLAKDNEITLGKVEAIGAVKKATIAYYDQTEKKYEELTIDEHLEITSLIGNISQRDKAIALHAHVNLGAKDGRIVGGHLLPGTPVFACEVMLSRCEGPLLMREFDDTTRLPLWKL